MYVYMCVCIYIYIYIYIYIHTHTYIHTYIHTHTHTHIYQDHPKSLYMSARLHGVIVRYLFAIKVDLRHMG